MWWIPSSFIVVLRRSSCVCNYRIPFTAMEIKRLADAYRATGADGVLGDPAAAHGVPFEGYFWRIVDPRSDAVVVALCAVCRGPDGSWGLSTLASHPGGFSRTAITRTASADPA